MTTVITQSMPISILSMDEYEEYLDSQDKELKASIAESRKQARNGEVLTFDEVFGS